MRSVEDDISYSAYKYYFQGGVHDVPYYLKLQAPVGVKYKYKVPRTTGSDFYLRLARRRSTNVE